MGGFLTDDDLNQLQPADEVMFPSPIPTQVVSSDEFWPMPQTEKQKAVEARIKEMADEVDDAFCKPHPVWRRPSLP
jgi:hypothetical protein